MNKAYLFILVIIFSCSTTKNINTEYSSLNNISEFNKFTKDFEKNYIYLKDKNELWECIKDTYSKKVGLISTKVEHILFYENLLNELYDNHIHLNTNTNQSYRLDAPIYVTNKNGKSYIKNVWQTQIKDTIQANIIGAEIVTFNGVNFQNKIESFATVCQNKKDEVIREWIANIEELVKEGITYHDNGEFEKAIQSYKKALKIDAKSTLVHYELALSYFQSKDYKNAIKHSDIVLKQKSKHMIPAYMTKGSALDLMGKTKESIKLFEKAIKKHGGHYLLYYNLALNYVRENELNKAEKNLIEGIKDNPSHPSSHLLLASIHDRWGNKTQTLLSTHYFLLLEPSSKRSASAYEMLLSNFSGNVSKDEKNANTINIQISENQDKEFSAAELTISMLEATKSLEENKGKTEEEMFIENTTSFFKILGELKKKKNKGIWWDFYIPFFYDLANSDHLPIYCQYISIIANENPQKWFEENEEKINAFDNWLNED